MTAGLDETLAHIREQCVIATVERYTLAQSLRAGSVADGLQAVEKLCATLLMTEELVGLVARANAPASALAEAERIRESMVSEIGPWLAAAVHDLPGAEPLIRQFYFAHIAHRDSDPPAHGGDETELS